MMVLRILLGLSVFGAIFFLLSWVLEKQRIRSMSYIERRNLQIAEEMTRERDTGERNALLRVLRSMGYDGDLAPFLVGVAFLYLIVSALTLTLGMSSRTSLLIGLPGAIGMTVSALSYVERRRQAAATTQMMQVVRNVVTFLEATNTPQQAFYKAANLVGNPLRQDLLNALNSQVGAVGMGAALAPLRDRYDSPATRLLVSALEVNDIVGARLGPTLRQAEEILRQQLELSAEANAEISQARAEFFGISAVIGLIACVLLLGAGEAASDAYSSPLGVTLLSLGVANYMFGIWRTLRVFRKAKRGLL
jgi:Flp pilus assembly protein TadB